MTMVWEGARTLPQRPFRRLFRRLDRPVPHDAGIVTAYTDGQVTLRANRDKERYHEAADLSTYQGVEPGDFVVHGLDILRGSVGVSESRGAMSPVVTVCAPGSAVDGRYVAYAMRLMSASGFPKALARGVRDGGADFRRWDTLGALPIPVPPRPQQAAVADFLDGETAKIDALIEKQTRLVAGLEERKSALHSSIFLGHDDWPQVPVRRLATAVIDCPHWTPEVVDESDYEAVRSGCIRDARYRPEAALRVDRAVFDARTRGVPIEPGDVLFAREAPAGEACLAPEGRRLCLGQRTVLLKIDRSQILPDLVIANLYSRRVQHYFAVTMNGSTVGNLRLPVIRGTTLVVPPVGLQAGLVGAYSESLEEIAFSVAQAERFVELARERRSALITAAVTGQIDVGRGA